MVLLNKSGWEIAGGAFALAILGGVFAWRKLRKRPSEEELERLRRDQLVQSGRLVDGMLLDIREMAVALPAASSRSPKPAREESESPLCEAGPVREEPGPGSRALTLLFFSYRIGGVDYECSQEITELRPVVDVAQIRVGFPCSVRYQPGNPQNSIVLAEGWSGLRAGLPKIPAFEDRKPVDTARLRQESGRA